MSSGPLEEQVLRLQALNLIQSADIASLLDLLLAIQKTLVMTYPDLATSEADFVASRKRYLHAQLELIENTQPELAGLLQQMIDRDCQRYPFDYD